MRLEVAVRLVVPSARSTRPLSDEDRPGSGLEIQKIACLDVLPIVEANHPGLLTRFEPIFKVADVARAVAWFERAGFEVSWHDDTYAFAH
jgi:hypothetical protein